MGRIRQGQFLFNGEENFDHVKCALQARLLCQLSTVQSTNINPVLFLTHQREKKTFSSSVLMILT